MEITSGLEFFWEMVQVIGPGKSFLGVVILIIIMARTKQIEWRERDRKR